MGTFPFGVARQDEGFSSLSIRPGLASSRIFHRLLVGGTVAIQSSRLFPLLVSFLLFSSSSRRWVGSFGLCRPEQAGRRSTQASHTLLRRLPTSVHTRPRTKQTECRRRRSWPSGCHSHCVHAHALDDSHHATFTDGRRDSNEMGSKPSALTASRRNPWFGRCSSPIERQATPARSFPLQEIGSIQSPDADMFRLRLLTGMST